MYVIREAQEHHRNVELHLYRKVCLLVCPSIFESSWKKSSKWRIYQLTKLVYKSMEFRYEAVCEAEEKQNKSFWKKKTLCYSGTLIAKFHQFN